MIRSFLGNLWCKNLVEEDGDVVGGDVVVVMAVVGVEGDVADVVLFLSLIHI